MKITRRHFLKKSGLFGVSSFLPLPALAMGNRPAESTASQTTKILRVVTRSLDVNGKPAKVFGLIGPDGKSGLRFKAGERFHVKLQNESGEPTLIHWHGLTPPWQQDGVPGIGQKLLPHGQFYDYDFALAHSGTNWMHAHTLQEQQMMAAPLIVEEKTVHDEQEIIMLLHDFSFQSPEEILAKLKAAKPNPETEMDHGNAHIQHNDVEYDAYLANDRNFSDPEVVKVDAGGHIRLRVINAATSTGFTLDISKLGVEAELVAVDGMDCVPVRGMQFPIAMAQRCDLRLTLPKGAGVYSVVALREGGVEQTGIILQAGGAQIAKIENNRNEKGPILSQMFERQLQAIYPLAIRAADQKIRYGLRGDMIPYAWELLRLDQENTEGMVLQKGQRIEIAMHNQSMMAHPIHLHGHHFQIVEIEGERFQGALRDTVLLNPHGRISIAFDANNAGAWPFHCHHLYHMVSGMMTFARYA